MTATVAAIFFVVYAGMILGGLPFLQLDRTGVALLGAIAIVGFGALTPEQAALSIHLPTLLLLFSFMVVSAQMRLGGFYAWVTLRIASLPFAAAPLLEKLRDKATFGELARAHGLPTPRTRHFRDLLELDAAAAELGFPLVVKRRVGSGARGVAYAADRAGLLAAARAALALDGSALLQEQLPAGGEGIGVSLLLWPDRAGERDGATERVGSAPTRVVAGFVHRRLREYPVTGGSSTFREAIRDDALIDRCGRFLAELGFVGVAMLEWKRDRRDDSLKLLECNPRFWGSLHQAVLSGVNFPVLLARLARGGEVDRGNPYRTDLRSRAFFPGDLLHWWKARPRPARFFRRSPDVVDELWRAGDPWPAAVKLLGFVPLISQPGIRRLVRSPAARTAPSLAPAVSSGGC